MTSNRLFKTALDEFNNGEVIITSLSVKQRYDKVKNIDPLLEKYFNNLKPVKTLSKDKVTITAEIQQGNYLTEVMLMYYCSDNERGNFKKTVEDSVLMFLKKVDYESDDVGEFIDCILTNPTDIHNIQRLCEKAFLNKKLNIHISNYERGYFTLMEVGNDG